VSPVVSGQASSSAMNHYSFEHSLNSKELARNPMALGRLSITSLSTSPSDDDESISMMAGMFHLRNKANRAGDLKSILGCGGCHS
jgi:hypothetical protein